MTTEPPGDIEHKLRAQSSRAPTRQYHLRTEGASRHQPRADQGHVSATGPPVAVLRCGYKFWHRNVGCKRERESRSQFLKITVPYTVPC